MARARPAIAARRAAAPTAIPIGAAEPISVGGSGRQAGEQANGVAGVGEGDAQTVHGGLQRAGQVDEITGGGPETEVSGHAGQGGPRRLGRAGRIGRDGDQVIDCRVAGQAGGQIARHPEVAAVEVAAEVSGQLAGQVEDPRRIGHGASEQATPGGGRHGRQRGLGRAALEQRVAGLAGVAGGGLVQVIRGGLAGVAGRGLQRWEDLLTGLEEAEFDGQDAQAVETLLDRDAEAADVQGAEGRMHQLARALGLGGRDQLVLLGQDITAAVDQRVGDDEAAQADLTALAA